MLVLIPPQEIQRRAGAEPGDLLRVERMSHRERLLLAVGVVEHRGERLAGREPREPADADAIALLHPVVIGRILERERQYTLLLPIGFVDARKAAHERRR